MVIINLMNAELNPDLNFTQFEAAELAMIVLVTWSMIYFKVLFLSQMYYLKRKLFSFEAFPLLSPHRLKKIWLI